MKNFISVFLLSTIVICSGCSTVITHAGRSAIIGDEGGVYEGTIMDSGAIVAPFIEDASLWFFLPYGLIDFPLSLAADTLILPYDLVDAAAKKKKRDVQTQNEEAAHNLALLFKFCDNSDTWDFYPATLQDLSKALRALGVEDTLPQCKCPDGSLRDFVYIPRFRGDEGRDWAFLFSPPEMGGDLVIVTYLDATTKVRGRKEATMEMEKSYAYTKDRGH